MPLTAVHCQRCGTKTSLNWWKCCPEHNTEHGDDVTCEKCVHELHPGEKEFERTIISRVVDFFTRLWNTESF